MSTQGHPAEGPASLMADGGQRIPALGEPRGRKRRVRSRLKRYHKGKDLKGRCETLPTQEVRTYSCHKQEDVPERVLEVRMTSSDNGRPWRDLITPMAPLHGDPLVAWRLKTSYSQAA